jgi:hypothetical protein
VEPLSAAWHSAVRLLFALHAECGTASDAELSYAAVVRRHERDESGAMRDTLGDILQSGCRGRFWGLLTSAYGALGLHQEAVSLALQHAPGGDSTAAEAHVAAAAAHVSAATARALWTQIAAARPGDELGVAARSGGALRVDDVLPLMAGFSRASPGVTAAVAASLGAHQGAATRAAADAQHTLGRTAAMRRDIAAAAAWRAATGRAPCGHAGDAGAPCACCGPDAIASLDAPLLRSAPPPSATAKRN